MITVNKDITFNKPSAAAEFILGSSSNGKTDIKDMQGNAIEKYYNQNKNINYRSTNIKSTGGHFYIVTNSKFINGWTKIGITENIDVDERIKQYQTYAPFNSYAHYFSYRLNNPKYVEDEVKKYYRASKFNIFKE